MIPKIWKALADDDLRPVMNHALVTPEFVVASDAHILVKHRTIDLFPETFMNTIPKTGVFFNAFILKELAKKSASTIEFTKDKKAVRIQHSQNRKYNPNLWIVEAQVFYKLSNSPLDKDKSPIDQYPAYDKAIPDLKELGPLEVIAFKTVYMNNLAEAMGGSNIRIRFKNVASAIFVKSSNEEYQAVGLIMPVMWDK